MKKLKKIFIMIFSFIALLSLIVIVLCNRLPDKGREIDKIEKEIKALEEENQELRLGIATQGSLLNIAQQAEAKGFQEPLVLYIKKQPKIAFEP